MFWVTRIFELLSATKKLNDSKPHVMSAVSSLTVVVLLGIFAAFLSAVMIAGLLGLIYWQIIVAGGTVLMAALITAAITCAILMTTALWASAVFGRVRTDVDRIFHSQAPIVAPAVNKVTNVASAFMSGLRTSHGVPHTAALKKAERSRR